MKHNFLSSVWLMITGLSRYVAFVEFMKEPNDELLSAHCSCILRYPRCAQALSVRHTHGS